MPAVYTLTVPMMVCDRHNYSALAELLPLLRMERFERLVLAGDVDDCLRQLLLVALELVQRPLLQDVPASDPRILSTSLLRKFLHEEHNVHQ